MFQQESPGNPESHLAFWLPKTHWLGWSYRSPFDQSVDLKSAMRWLARATAHLADSMADWACTMIGMFATQLFADRAHTIIVMIAAQLLAVRANTIAVVVAAQPLADRTNAVTVVVAPKLKIAHRPKLSTRDTIPPQTKKRGVANRWNRDHSGAVAEAILRREAGWLNAVCRSDDRWCKGEWLLKNSVP
jgi:hypothetical protein